MKKYIFQGNSDDTFGEYNVTRDDYDNCAADEPIRYTLTTPDGTGVLVVGHYVWGMNSGEGWMIGVSTLNEEKNVDWLITINPSGERGYDCKCTIEAPNDAELTCLERA